MDREDNNHNNNNLSIAEYKPLNHHQTTSGWLEIRLFYVRITPCAVNAVPEQLTLRTLRREIGVSLEINGFKYPSSKTALVTLRKDRVDKESSEVTYVSTDHIRVTGAIEFEVIDNESDDRDTILCGSLERIDPTWSNGSVENGHRTSGSKTGWSMDFHTANLSKFGTSLPSIEVYIAGCCSSVPVILTKTVQVSPRRRGSRQVTLDAIPEDEEVDNGVLRQLKVPPHTREENDEYESEVKVGTSYYSDEMYYDEDGELTWFNAGVRVGVGIGLGMCLGVGIGVGLLMRSYQATTRNFRRRFF